MSDTSAPFGFTFGASHIQTEWSDFRRLTWPQIVETLTSHVPGPKEGPCIVPAHFRGSRRHKDDAARIDVAFLDSDSGMTLAEIEAALKARRWEAVISSTHSHMTTRTRVSVSNWDRFFAAHPDATPEQFLVEEKGYLPRIAAGARAAETVGQFLFIEHQPCPKFRVAIPLERPWLAEEYRSQAEANAAWKERIEALAASLGLPHDQACTDTSRLFYLPRRPENGAVPETAVVAGAHCDIFALPAPQTPGLFERPAVKGTATDSLEWIDPIQGEVIDLQAWAKTYGHTFLIAKALKARKPGALTGHAVEGKVHIDCPNASAHTDPVRDGATYVVNAGSPSTRSGGFVIHCRHAHCTDRDRLFFLRRMLEEGWIGADDLTAPEFQARGEVAEKAHADAPLPLPLLWFDEIEPVLDVTDFVQGVLTERSSCVVYGDSNAGKTFWLTDLVLHVAAGLPWNGRRVEQGGVVYGILEGGNGFRNRVAAWRREHALDGVELPFAAIPAALDLRAPDADVHALIATVKAAAARMTVPLKVVVVDTLSRAMAGGNENSPEDMGALVRNMDLIRQETGVCVVFIHHSGKDQARGARGHSLLRAAIDTEIEVIAPEVGDVRTAAVVKQRDLKKGDVFGFTLKVCKVGENRYGEDVTTCVVQPADAEEVSGKSGNAGKIRLPETAQIGIRALQNALGRKGAQLPHTSEYPVNTSGVSHSVWREEFYQLLGDAAQETKKKNFQNAEKRLLVERLITTRNGLVWFVKSEMEPGK